MSEILTSYHKRGREEGSLEALQRTLCKQVKQKLSVVSPETETMILETTSIPHLEKALEQIFDLDSEQALWKMLNDKNE